MSTTDIESIEHTLTELELRIQARIGKWAIAIIGSCIGMAIMGASQWFPTIGRIENLERWSNKRESEYPVSQYNTFREQLEGRLSKIETTQARQGEDIREILALLKRQP